MADVGAPFDLGEGVEEQQLPPPSPSVSSTLLRREPVSVGAINIVPGAPPTTVSAPIQSTAVPFTTQAIKSIIDDSAVDFFSTSGYEISYNTYIQNLEPSLRFHYPVPQKPKVKKEDEKVENSPSQKGDTIHDIKKFILENKSAAVKPPEAQWSKNAIAKLVDGAAKAIPEPPTGTPFNRVNFLNAMKPLMSDQARQDEARGVGKGKPIITTIPAFQFTNIGS